MKAVKLYLLVLFIFTSHHNLSAQVYEMEASKTLMGTEFKIIGYDEDIELLKRAIYFSLKEVERIEQVMSIYIPDSEASIINMNATYEPVTVSIEMFNLLKRSIKYSEMTGGLFDITIGAVTEHWGINTRNPVSHVPDQNIIDSLVSLTDFKNILLDEDNSTVRFLQHGMKIDLGGIAKGYAIDRAVNVMHENGIENFLISGGGDVYLSGLKAGSESWTVGMKYPDSEIDSLMALLVINQNCAVISSGDYERYIVINGIKYHHIFNPNTGFPDVTSNSATVVTSTAEAGVVLSKILFMLGEKFASGSYFDLVKFAYSLNLGSGEYVYDPDGKMRR